MRQHPFYAVAGFAIGVFVTAVVMWAIVPTGLLPWSP